MNLIVNKHFKFSVIWTNSMGKIKEFNTNCEDTALKMQLRRKGELYFRPRYSAELRLQRFYVYLFNNGKLCQDDVQFNLVTII